MGEFPMAKHLLSALRSAGGGVELAGGYDPSLNQVFICCNNADSIGLVHGALVRNLIQMFDVCVNHYDVTNAEHLACTEVRKANLANCGWLVHMQQPWAKLSWKQGHAECVRRTAVDYLIRTKFVKEKFAVAAVDKVFDRCYQDLEPIGRRSIDALDIKR